MATPLYTDVTWHKASHSLPLDNYNKMMIYLFGDAGVTVNTGWYDAEHDVWVDHRDALVQYPDYWAELPDLSQEM